MAQDQYSRNRSYLAAIALLSDMVARSLIDTKDYCAVETEYAAKFLPLFRYKKPCNDATLPITLTGQGRH